MAKGEPQGSGAADEEGTPLFEEPRPTAHLDPDRLRPLPPRHDEAPPEEGGFPERIGDYRLLRRLGSGGIGVVYLAVQESLERRVALKVLHPGLLCFAGQKESILREARTAAALDHPGICSIFEAGEAEGIPYLAMQYVEGRSLAALVEERQRGRARPTPPGRGEILTLLSQVEKVARTAHAAHEVGLVHRDIKPGNIMITPRGEPVLLDFGLARFEEEGRLTRTGQVQGTPHYLAPEGLAEERRPLDRRADIYSICLTLFEAVSLQNPFESNSVEGVYRKVLNREPPDLERLNPAAPADLGPVLRKGLDKDPRRRFATALELAEELRRVRCFEPIRTRPAGPVTKVSRWFQRNTVLGILLIALGLSLGSGLAATWSLLAKSRKLNRELRAEVLRDQAEESCSKGDHRTALKRILQSLGMAVTPRSMTVLNQLLFRRTLTCRMVLLSENNIMLATSPRGDRFLTWTHDGPLVLWDREGRRLEAFRGTTGEGEKPEIRRGLFLPPDERSGGAMSILVAWRNRKKGESHLGIWQPGSKDIREFDLPDKGRGSLSRLHHCPGRGKIVAFFNEHALVFNRNGELLNRIRSPFARTTYFCCAEKAGRLLFLETGPASYRVAMTNLDGKALLRLERPGIVEGNGLRVIDLAPDGRHFVLTVGRDKTTWLELYETGRGRLIHRDQLLTKIDSVAAFSPSGDSLAYKAGDGHSLCLVYLKTDPVRIGIPRKVHDRPIASISFSPLPRREILTCDSGGTASTWKKKIFNPVTTANLLNIKPEREMSHPDYRIITGRFLPAADRVLTVCGTRLREQSSKYALSLWGGKPDRYPNPFPTCRMIIHSGGMTGGDERLLTISPQGGLIARSMTGPAATPRIISYNGDLPDRVDRVVTSPDGKLVFLGWKTGEDQIHLQVRDSSSGLPLRLEETGRVGRVFFDAFHSQDGSRVVLNFVRGSALYEPGPNRIRWFSRGDYPWLFREHDKPEEFSTWNDVAFFPDGDRLLIASKMSPAKVIDRNGRILCTLACRGRGGDWATKVAVSPRGRWILTSSLKGPVRIWRVRDRNLVALAAVLPTLGLDQLNALGFIPGGGGFYTAGAGTSEEDPQRSQGFVRTRNLSGEKTWEELLTDPVIRFTYSRDGRFFLAGTTRFCRVWSAPDRRTLYDMPFAGLGRLGKISIARNSIQFSPSGAWIMAKLRNETMRKALLYWPTRVEDLIGWGRQKLGDRRE